MEKNIYYEREQFDIRLWSTIIPLWPNPGISTRLFCEVFDTLALLQQTSADFRCSITVSYAEIYNGSVLDLLTMTDNKPASRRSSREATVPETPAGVLNLDGISEFPVNSPEEMCKHKEHGDKARKMGSNRLRCCSASLSHAVFSIRIRHSSKTHLPLCAAPEGLIHIVDLASSNASACLHCQDDPPTPEMEAAAAAVDKSLSALRSLLNISFYEQRSRLTCVYCPLSTATADLNKSLMCGVEVSFVCLLLCTKVSFDIRVNCPLSTRESQGSQFLCARLFRCTSVSFDSYVDCHSRSQQQPDVRR